MERQPVIVTQEFHDALTELSDGSDVTDFFESDDTTWLVENVRLFKWDDGGIAVRVQSLMFLEVGDPE